MRTKKNLPWRDAEVSRRCKVSPPCLKRSRRPKELREVRYAGSDPYYQMKS